MERPARLRILGATALLALAPAACSGRPPKGGREPVEIQQIPLPDAGGGLTVGEPTIDSPCPDSCAVGACDGDLCRRCLLAVDKTEQPDGRALDDPPVTLDCAQMTPAARMTITASGEVEALGCASWSADLLLARSDGAILGQVRVATDQQVYPVFLEGAAITASDGTLSLRLEPRHLSSDPPGCAALTLKPGFTITVAP